MNLRGRLHLQWRLLLLLRLRWRKVFAEDRARNRVRLLGGQVILRGFLRAVHVLTTQRVEVTSALHARLSLHGSLLLLRRRGLSVHHHHRPAEVVRERAGLESVAQRAQIRVRLLNVHGRGGLLNARERTAHQLLQLVVLGTVHGRFVRLGQVRVGHRVRGVAARCRRLI